jgi:cytochrome c oxidase assembly protein subunit 15
VRGFNRLCLTTLAVVYFLILLGSIVRTTGSGMGCPDWPKCFGNWTPPSSVEQLPANYKETYASIRQKKNEKFARYLRLIGLTETAQQLVGDNGVRMETDFNVTKAWIEYGNRLVGVITGFFIVALCWQSRKFRTTNARLFYTSLATLVAVVIQGWFGSIVVSTNLTIWTVTVHMFLALLIVALLVYILFQSEASHDQPKPSASLQWLLAASLFSLFIQIALGTRVRESLDLVAARLPDRNVWIGALGMTFLVHRLFSLVVLTLHVALVRKIAKTMGSNALSRGVIILILGALATGAAMAYDSVPAILQPVHLALATGAFGAELLLFFRVAGIKKIVLTS